MMGGIMDPREIKSGDFARISGGCRKSDPLEIGPYSSKKEEKMSSIFCKIRDFCLMTILILLMAALSSAGAQQNPASPDRETAQPTETPSRVTILKGTVAHAPAKGLVLFYGHDRRTADLDANGSFSCSLELQAPVYVQMEFEFQKGRRLIVLGSDGQIGAEWAPRRLGGIRFKIGLQ
jgi:hypothetical protein